MSCVAPNLIGLSLFLAGGALFVVGALVFRSDRREMRAFTASLRRDRDGDGAAA